MAAFKTDGDIAEKLENLFIEDKLLQNSYKKFIEILVNLFTYKIKFSLADIINIRFVIEAFDSSIRYIAPLLRNLKKLNPRLEGKPSFKIFDTSFEDKSKKEINFFQEEAESDPEFIMKLPNLPFIGHYFISLFLSVVFRPLQDHYLLKELVIDEDVKNILDFVDSTNSDCFDQNNPYSK